MQNYTAYALILAVLVQGVAVVFTVSGMVHQIDANQDSTISLRSDMEEMRRAVHENDTAIARIDTNLEYIKQAVSVIVAAK